MAREGKVAKKLALYPPKRLMNELGLKEGQRVKYKVEGGKLVVEPLPDPIDIALHSKKWAKTSAREFELESEKEQSELYA
ncbi:MAG: AbrB/MazE/SpoVT family DNA-binding domain-containing protein [Thaumarchaeota archaeon]|nr:AbrB/MazE/SpoVT family DNA-binding domain-containing protein [Nitrososphaerota archaeon]